jgi:hypothetical protein
MSRLTVVSSLLRRVFCTCVQIFDCELIEVIGLSFIDIQVDTVEVE